MAPASRGDRAAEAPFEAFAALAYPEVELVVHPQCWAADGHFAEISPLRMRSAALAVYDGGEVSARGRRSASCPTPTSPLAGTG